MWIVEPPERMRLTAESMGASGREWLAALPARVERMCRRWSLTPVAALDGGSAALVLKVLTSGGTDAVLRLAPPGDGFAGQVRTLAAADGRGYVRLYEYDLAHDAALLEALGPPLSATAAAPEDALDVLAATLRQAWLVPRPPGAVVPPGTGKASTLYDLIELLWERGVLAAADPVGLVRGWCARLSAATGIDEQAVGVGVRRAGLLRALHDPSWRARRGPRLPGRGRPPERTVNACARASRAGRPPHPPGNGSWH